MLFASPWRFQGLPEAGFRAFAVPERDARRLAIVEGFHPALHALAEDLVERLAPVASFPLHAHVPRLDWPPGYQPFCTWLAISHRAQGYQDDPQLNFGVHRDHVALRLGWDTASAGFGRFQFLSRHGVLGTELRALAEREGLRFRVYAPTDWPDGSTCVFESPEDVAGSFLAAERRGVWWELGARYELPGQLARVCSPEFGPEVERVFRGLLPACERILG